MATAVAIFSLALITGDVTLLLRVFQPILCTTRFGIITGLLASESSFRHLVYMANLGKMAVAERREAEPMTERSNGVGLPVRPATIESLAESDHQ